MFMEEVAGRPMSTIERDLTREWTVRDCAALGANIDERKWVRYPATAALDADVDPGQVAGIENFQMPDPKKIKKARRKAAKGH